MRRSTSNTFRVLIILAFASLIIYKAYATSSGSIYGRTSTTSSGCGSCHGSNSNSETSVSIVSGSGSFVVAPNSVTTFTITVTNSNEVAAGIDIAVKTDQTGDTDIGTLAPVSGGGLHVDGSELTHISPRTLSGGTCTFQFKWTAPSTPGTYYMRAIANAVNLNGVADAGDHWNWMPI
ncbi:MAG: choice-of-anchor V domain-containing protein, partial [FCB group bacterium]